MRRYLAGRRPWRSLLALPGRVAGVGPRRTSSLSPDQRGNLDILRTLAESLQTMPKSLNKWTSADWFMRLTMLSTHNSTRHHVRRSQLHRPDAVRLSLAEAAIDAPFLHELPYYIRICDASYAFTTKGFLRESKLSIAPDDILQQEPGGVFAPKYYLYVDHGRHEVVLVIRGSASIQDFCTDMCMDHEPFQTGYGHRGIVHAAHWLDWKLRDDMINIAADYPTYSVHVMGHSLGAGAAALVSTLWATALPRLRCLAFAPPACLTLELAQACEGRVVSVVCGDDCVPRLNSHNLVRLQEEVVAFDISAALKSMMADEIEAQKSVASESFKQLREAMAIVDEMKETASSMVQATSTNDKSAIIDKLSTQWVKLAKPALPTVEADVGLFLRENRDKLTQLWTTVEAQVQRTEELLRLDKPQLQALAQLKAKLNTQDMVLLRQKLDFLAVKPDNAATKEIMAKWSRLDVKVMVMEGLLKFLHDPERKRQLIAQLELLLRELARVRSSKNTGLNAMLEPLSNQVYELLVKIKSTLQHDNLAVPLTASFTWDARPKQPAPEAAPEKLLPFLERKVFDIVDGFCDELRKETTSILELSQAGDGGLEALLQMDPALQTAPLYPPGKVYVLEKDPSGATPTVLSVTAVDTYFNRINVSNDMLLDHLCTTYEASILSLLPPPPAKDM
ncbi:hypothetical protein SDRG_14503 [Saprolegnia diclina VS20]|uniref:Fungal lipase-type domain-containing protein n=1 Tax=Saprolegnia diclina (strain VS20) TaxID=1156394 RepID=T0PQH3_SAPDV|nr:hypothetical protein SDRG_14503 [Saprolegnia diclina VS20]EQC27754.1 hypothetical protein SDRG_14503 [Saprolegnia diclina VS20]|eukprot:XP_008618859.1 hypothetical protein SDRG_14503 [Saprolegnia diclina VS20]